MAQKKLQIHLHQISTPLKNLNITAKTINYPQSVSVIRLDVPFVPLMTEKGQLTCRELVNSKLMIFRSFAPL